MRVPDISSTAGYAGSPFTQANNTTSASYSFVGGATGRHSLEIELNKNGNFDEGNFDLGLHESRSLYRQAAFSSSADEFVQKALNSSPTEATAAADGPTSNLKEFDAANCNGHQQKHLNNLYKRSDSVGAQLVTDLNDLDDTGNTYRSFKEVFNINKSLFEGCVKDFENIDTIENSNLQLSDTELDPILIINSQLKNDGYNNGTSSSPSYPYEFCISPTDHLDMKTKNVEQQVVAKTITFNENPKEENFNTCAEKRFENLDADDLLHGIDDYEDQSMIDLCNEGTKSSYDNDDRDEYLTSPTSSSSISMRTSKRSYFPRGIINPNYPGFQHLAHTLSEHFIGNNSVPTSESYDSDMSEYEMELSADSFEDLPEEQLKQQQQQVQLNTNLKNNNFNNNFNNNNNNVKSLVETQQPSAEFIKMANGSEYISKLDITTITYSSDSNYNSNPNSEMDIYDLPDNLETVLTLLEPPMCVEKTTKLYPNQANPHSSILHKPPQPPACITPDILIKNPTCRNLSTLSKKENRPDLLRGVSPQPVRITSAYEPKHALISDTKTKAAITTLKTMPHSCNNTTRTVDLTKDEISLGITPVDIIGDFGREVEREFGLLVSGYRRLVDGCVEVNEEDEVDDDDEDDDEDVEYAVQQSEKVTDAILSSANDQIDSKFLAVYQQLKDDETICDKEDDSELADSNTNTTPIKHMTTATTALTEFLEEEDNNAVDWCCTSTTQEAETAQQPEYMEVIVEDTKKFGDGTPMPKYQKSSYDDRQLPPVAIDYKRCQLRTARKPPQNLDNPKGLAASSSTTAKVTRNYVKPTSFANRLLHSKRGFGGTGSSLKGEKAERKREEAELNQYQQLISEKELILSNSRYAKMSSWAQYLKNSVKDRKGSCELISPSALDLFDAYRIGTEIDMETLQQHMKLAKEIEKKRRSDREEIRRRLAMGAEQPNCNEQNERQIWKPTLQSRIQNGVHFCRANEISSSDTESHSSDSETCPKLSKRHQPNLDIFDIHASTDKSAAHPYKGRPLSVSCANNNKPPQQQQQQGKPQQKQQEQQQEPLLLPSNEDKECDFFTKQARLQIEARMALAQAKEMAHMQMEIDRQNQRISPITAIIRGSLEKVGVRMTVETRRVSRQMLTEMNTAQLQVLVNSLHSHIEGLNGSLVHFLMERDDLHMGQDAMLVDIEELTRYIGAKEQIAQQDRKTIVGKRSK